jgi:hypothetical protein
VTFIKRFVAVMVILSVVGIGSAFATLRSVRASTQIVTSRVLGFGYGRDGRIKWLDSEQVRVASLDRDMANASPRGPLRLAAVRSSVVAPVRRVSSVGWGRVSVFVAGPFLLVADYDGSSWFPRPAPEGHASGYEVHGRSILFALFGNTYPLAEWNTGAHFDGF